MTGKKFVEGATVTPLGDAWGTPLLWRVENVEANESIDVHAEDEAAARKAASAAFDVQQKGAGAT